MKNSTKGWLIKKTAIALDVGAPLIATLSQFPVWVERSAEASFSGLFIVLAFVACIPFLKQLKEFWKSPSIPIVWLILFILFLALYSVIKEILIVSFVGTIANFAGAGIYKLGTYIGEKPDLYDGGDP